MTPEQEKFLKEVRAIEQLFNESNDTSPDYLPDVLLRLRNYVFQVHASYEKTMDILIASAYVSEERGNRFDRARPILNELSFYTKTKIVELEHNDFPVKTARKLNALRNDFAHKDGLELRQLFTDQQRLKALRFLKECHGEENAYWQAQQDGVVDQLATDWSK